MEDEELPPPTPPVPVPRQHLATGPICLTCGNLMIRTGACHTCPHCGDTDGCG